MVFLGLDFAVSALLQSFSFPALDLLMLALTNFGSPVFWFAVATVLMWKGEEKQSFFLMNLMVFASAVVGALKFAVARPRPFAEGFRELQGEYASRFKDYLSSYSFPSGHATLVSAVFAYTHRLVSRFWWVVLGLAVAVVSVSRIYIGAHYLSDVVAGVALGLVIGYANYRLLKRFEGSRIDKMNSKEDVAFLATLVVGIIVFALFQPPVLFAAVLGYYLGFFAFKGLGFDSERLSGRRLLVKLAIGFAVIGLLGVPVLLFEDLAFEVLVGLFLASGLWVSLIWPVVWETVLNKSK